MIKSFSKINTFLGDITISASEDAVTGIYREGQENLPDKDSLGEYVGFRAFEDVAEQLQEYFTGQRNTFKLFTIQRGTSFQRLVWRTIGEIPYGDTISYEELRQMVGTETSIKAVAAAVAKNPLAIVTPCHRVAPAKNEEKFSPNTLNRKELVGIEQSYKSNF